MKNILLFLIISWQYSFSQAHNGIYQLNSIDSLLTEEVKAVIDEEIQRKKVVFLGESVHYSGSDMLAKVEFVKYLVRKHNYKDIAFESDFFALLFDHHKRNLYSIWSKSSQCEKLFTFLEENSVTIWGFDNRLIAPYSYENFIKKLDDVLNKGGIELDEEYGRIAKILIKNQYNSRKALSTDEIDFLYDYTKEILESDLIKSNTLWIQILNSFNTAIELYTVRDNKSDKKRIAIRDRQMAKNLDFLIDQNPNKKFIVWLANGHMSKSNSASMNGQTMGFQFRQLNPESSYHIALGSIRLAPRTERDIEKAANNDKSILSLLPKFDNNYFIDANRLIKSKPEFGHRLFSDLSIFNLESDKTYLLNHFDALVFIAKGEEVKYD